MIEVEVATPKIGQAYGKTVLDVAKKSLHPSVFGTVWRKTRDIQTYILE